MVTTVDGICHTKSGVSGKETLAPLSDQLLSLELQNKKTCCSYGYSQDIVPYGMLPSGKRTPKLRRLVHMWVDDMIEQGVENFLCPMEQGADLMVAERVIALRSVSDKPIKLIACLTHCDMDKEIGAMFLDSFHSLCQQADAIVYASSIRGGRRVRRSLNMAMMGNSAFMLAVYQNNKPPQVLKDAETIGLTIAHIQVDLIV